MRKLLKLRRDQKAWVHAKLTLALWAVMLMLFTPTPVENALGVFITAAISLTVVAGVAVSIGGMLHAQSVYTAAIRKGVKIELAGLWLAISGPAAYLLVQLFLVIYGEDPLQRFVQIFVYYSLCSFLAVRVTQVEMSRKKMSS